jgi:vacuolar-type H+-ATPase subunit H
MDAKIALDQVKEAELKAQEIVNHAKQEAQNILHAASIEKERILKTAQEKAKKESQNLKLEIEEAASREAGGIKNQSASDMAALKEKVRNNFEKASRFLREKI